MVGAKSGRLRSLVLVGVTATVVLPSCSAVAGAADQPPGATPAGYSLGIDIDASASGAPPPAATHRLDLDAVIDLRGAPLGNAFRLRLDTAATTPSGSETPPSDPSDLTLETRNRTTIPGPAPPSFADPEELAAHRWPPGPSRMDVQIEREQARVREQGLVGSQKGAGLLLSGTALVRLAQALARAVRGDPTGPPLAARPLRLKIREADGATPGSIVVDPFVPGAQTAPIHARCDDLGTCMVEGLPATPSVLTIRSHGMAVVPHDGAAEERAARLRPAATVTVDSPQCLARRWRLVDSSTRVALPPPEPLDPDRDGWIEPQGSPISLLVPSGTYGIEVGPPVPGEAISVALMAHQNTCVSLPPCSR